MDIKAKADEVIAKIKSDKNIKSNFEKNPIKTVEDILGIDLPDGVVDKVVDVVKTKLTADAVGDIAGKLGGLFGKK